MILLSMVKPVLMLCMLLLYISLGWRFLRAKSKLQISGLKNGVGSLAKKKRQLALFGALFFLLYFIGRLLTELWTPGMLMIFNYEEAARGQNPNATRFNESNILSEHILEKVIQRGNLKMSPEQLSDYLSISTPLDSEKLDVSQESDLKISTEYWIHCSERVSLHHTKPQTVLNFLADVYREDFTLNYAENDSVLDLSFEDLEGMEYLDVKDYLQMQATKVRDYLPGYSSESSSFRAEKDQETFSSLYQKIENYINIELERYGAFILEKGLSTNKDTYQSRMQYANHLLENTRLKEMAAHDVRIEAIDIYDAFMTRFVLIPTYDVEQEFYMSRTKVGVDYFAEEATEFLAEATKLVEEMEHNTYASAQVGKSQAPSNAYEEADRQIDSLKDELLNLAEQSRTLCDTYIAEKRDGYIQVCFSSPSASGIAVDALLLTLLFVIALGGNMLLEPFCQDSGKVRSAGQKAWRLGRKNGKTEKGDAS